MDEKIFNRVEKKYLIDKGQYRSIMIPIRKFMEHDGYYKSGVYNIYYDNDNYDLIIQSIEQPIFKEKLRVRYYKGYDKVFFEIKTKLRHGTFKDEDMDNNLGYKRRVIITQQDYNDFINKKAPFLEVANRHIEEGTDLQIAKEIDYLINLMDLKPRILMYYDRESYINDKDLRITFDKNLSYREKNINFNKKTHNQKYFTDDKNIIMEIKTSSAMPMWLVKKLSAEQIYPQRFSKIGHIYQRINSLK